MKIETAVWDSVGGIPNFEDFRLEQAVAVEESIWTIKQEIPE